MDTTRLERLRNLLLSSDNNACFAEREEALASHRSEVAALPFSQRYTREFELVMENLSTPLTEDDVFAGRMVEKVLPQGQTPYLPGGLSSEGHITLPMEKILTKGLAGIEEEVTANAEQIGTEEAFYFREQTARCIQAIRSYSTRYADAAEALGKTELAAACRTVPYAPAYDLFSALQSIWMTHFIFSTVAGARDFAPGRIDCYLRKFCTGSRNEMVELLAHFLLKFNEITGTCAWDYLPKPIPCPSSKQYLTLGPDFNEVSEMIVEAAAIVKLPQPILNFRLRDDFTLAGKAANLIGPQCNFFNDKLIHRKLLNSGILPADAENYAFTACNRVDLPGRLYNKMYLIDIFDNSTEWFREALFAADVPERILPELRRIAYEKIKADNAANRQTKYSPEMCFRLDSLAIDSCIQTCRDLYRNGAENYHWQHRMFSGIGTMTDSLNAVRELCKQYSYSQVLQIIRNNFEGEELLRRQICTAFPKFGNGNPGTDRTASDIANVLIDAFEQAAGEDGFIPMPSFYSLGHHLRYGAELGATPDGRKSGTPVSENQSPVYGMDRDGITSLLTSVSVLPFERCISGGLNVKFTTLPGSAEFEALLKSYFAMGGQHLGFTIVSRETLEAARKNPDDYRTLYVRITGFSEYFINISPDGQQELIDRTQH